MVSSDRRLLALWFPCLPTDRLQRRWSHRGLAADGVPLVIVAKIDNAMRLTAADRKATALGICAGQALASARAIGVRLLQMDARAIPFEDEFDVVGAFDVLEHIEEDEVVLAQLRAALSGNGGLIITVPQHMSLWSAVDEQSCHVRRYSARELQSKLEHAGFKIIEMTSFVSFLLPLLYLSRLRKREPSTITPKTELALPPLLNRGLEFVMAVERQFIRSGVRMPAGGSLLAIAAKA